MTGMSWGWGAVLVAALVALALTGGGHWDIDRARQVEHRLTHLPAHN